MPKGVANKRYTPEFKKLVIETMIEEKLSYAETRQRFDIAGEDRLRSWERRGLSIIGRPKKLPKDIEEDLLAEAQRLRAENDYLKNLQALVLEDERH